MSTAFISALSALMSILMMLVAPVNMLLGSKTTPITDAEEGCKLSFAAISDIHLTDSVVRQNNLELGLYDMEKAEDRLDAVVFDGDITDHGYYEMWDRFADTNSKYDIADNRFVVVGNHDTWGPDRENFLDPDDGVLATFIRYNQTVSGREIENMYYSDVINGYYMIALGSEDDCTDAFISNAQLEWFANEMAKAAETGLPIFVFLHQPINGTHGLPYNWELDEEQPFEKGGIGDQSDAVVEILKKYDNVFYMSGHAHAGFNLEGQKKLGNTYASVEYLENDNGNNITLINLPSFGYPDVVLGSHMSHGCGWIVEVYEGKVLIRARNFVMRNYISKYDVEVPLV